MRQRLSSKFVNWVPVKGKDFYKDSIEQVNVAYYIDGDTTHFKSINNNTPNIKESNS